jgi:predicted phosphoadenosine phosphosulfate sulfurtransferase
MRKRIKHYIKEWKARGYPRDIPEEVPDYLMEKNMAPSYKAIVIAILENDHPMESLGFTPKKSKWYNYYKKIELNKKT